MKDIYGYITTEEAAYKTVKVPLADGYEWNMFDHVNTTTLYLNSKRKNAVDGEDLPYGNIILPKILLQNRATKIKLSEFEFYIDSEDEDYKSFLVRKWHERYALTEKINHALNKTTQTFNAYGGVLLENIKGWGVVPFQRLAFCDQTDMLSGPICQKHQYSVSDFMAMASAGWGDPANGATGTLEQVVALATETKTNNQSAGGAQHAQTPGRYIEVYDLEGVLSEAYLEDSEDNENKFTNQLQVVTYYKDKSGKKQGITLFAKKKKEGRYKAKKRDDDDASTYGRALGRGGVEELFEPQVWYNYSLIQKTELLDQVSKVLNWTNDTAFKAKNDTADMKSGDTLVVSDGKTFARIDGTASASLGTVFDNAMAGWDERAKDIASARDAIAGEASKSGIPFREMALLNQENHSLHQDRKEQIADFLETEVYPDWVIPQMMKDVASGAEFMSYLSLDEMSEIVDQVVACHFNETIIGKVLSGEIVWPEDAQSLKDTYRQTFFKNNRKFITILEGEFKNLPVEVRLNIADQQKNLSMITEKLSSWFDKVTQILMVNPNFFTQHPEMAKLANQIVESTGLSALNFGMKGYIGAPQQGAAPQQLMQQQNAQVPQPRPQLQPQVPAVQGQPAIG